MAQIMKLDTRQDQLWKDKAMVELNAAVLHSFNVSDSAGLNCILLRLVWRLVCLVQSQGVTILDHHTGSEGFLRFMEQEVSDDKTNRAGHDAGKGPLVKASLLLAVP